MPSPAHTPPPRPASLPALAAFAAVAALVPTLGALASGPTRPGTLAWYRGLDKPAFTPPEAAFAPVWTALYAAIAASGWRVWRAEASPARSRALALWAVQLAFNAGWTPLFFGRRELTASLVDSVALLGAAGAYAAAAAQVDGPAGALVVPYVGWVALATAVNEEITRRNT